MADGNAAPTTGQQAPNPETAATKRPLSLLAAEYFGDEYHGEVPEQPETTETPSPDGETTETEEVETTETTETTEATETTEPDVADLIRQHFEADGALLTKIKLGVKVDGQSGEATLDDLVRSYQIQTAAEKRLEEAKSKSAELLAEANAKVAKIGERFAEAAGLIEALESDLADDIKSADMDKLRREDPAEWSAKTAEFDKRRAKIQQRKQDAVAKYHKANQNAQEEAKKAAEKYLQDEMAALFERRPEWRDKNTFKAEGTKMTEFLSAVRPNTAQLVVHNHELFELAHKARLYDELKANTNAASKKLEKVPKVLKPGTPTPPEISNKARIDKARTQARKSGSLDDALALLRAKRGNQK